jgi:hypothetical protein
MKNQKILFSLLIIGLLVTPFLVGAASEGVGKIVEVINNVVDLAITALCTLMVLYGGVVMLMSQGDPTKVANGRQIILWAAVGFIVAALAKSIALIIGSVVT